MINARRAAAWLRSFQPESRAEALLVCLPPAGAGAAFFRGFARRAPSWLRVVCVQYPGRQDRLAEAGFTDLHALADELSAILMERRERSLCLFGHSLGAAIAFELALRLESRTRVQLAVSGRAPPQRERQSTVHDEGDDALWADLRRLGGTAPELLSDPALRAALLPTLRSDYRMSETYRVRAGSSLRCATAAFVGRDDPEVSVDEARAWSELTSASFRLFTFDGGHFYLRDRESELMSSLVDWISAATPDSLAETARDTI